MKLAVMAAAACALAALSAAAQAQPRPVDRAMIDVCLQKQDEAEECIGTLYKACTERPPSAADKASPGSTPGQEDCAAREAAVWQEKIDMSLKALRAGPIGTATAQPSNRPAANKRAGPVPGADIIDDMQRTWEIWRAKMCDTRALRYEGGTFARTTYAICLYEEAARHALWLKEVEND